MVDFIKEITTNFQIDKDKKTVTITYDCGSLEDAENFENKVNDAIIQYKIKAFTSINDYVFDENNNDDEWNVVDVMIFYENCDIETIKNFIETLDTI